MSVFQLASCSRPSAESGGPQKSISLKNAIQLCPNEKDTVSALSGQQPLTNQFSFDLVQTAYSVYLLLIT